MSASLPNNNFDKIWIKSVTKKNVFKNAIEL